MPPFRLSPARSVILTVGEVMLRLSPPGRHRVENARSFECSWGGSEANVAVALSHWGRQVRHLTAAPRNAFGDSLRSELRRHGVDTAATLSADGRMGLYFVEQGAGPRASTVLYDRSGSAFANLDPDEVDIDAALDKVGWLHWSGITPALGPRPAELLRRLLRVARQRDILVSCDLNYRAKLWSSEDAIRTLTPLMPSVDLCVANEEDAQKALGFPACPPGAYAELARSLRERFSFAACAISVRQSHSATRNTWSGVLTTSEGVVGAQPRDLDAIVDRFGAGDAFVAGLIDALLSGLSPQQAIEFAAAAGAFKHTIPGDFLLASRDEIASLAAGDGSGRVQR